MKRIVKSKDISEIDLINSFFHYTNKDNFESIIENGLEPRIGDNSIYIEKTPKVFFVKGELGIITIIDVWLRWLTSKSCVNKFIYWLGNLYLKSPFYIKCIPNFIVKQELKSQKNRHKTYVKMKNILDNSIFFVLDLEENADFNYQDIDEVKNTYNESFLKLLYPQKSNLKDTTMEYWNMHTFSNKVIEPEKITLLKDNDTYEASKILNNIIIRNLEYIKNNCEYLYEYYIFLYNK